MGKFAQLSMVLCALISFSSLAQAQADDEKKPDTNCHVIIRVDATFIQGVSRNDLDAWLPIRNTVFGGQIGLGGDKWRFLLGASVGQKSVNFWWPEVEFRLRNKGRLWLGGGFMGARDLRDNDIKNRLKGPDGETLTQNLEMDYGSLFLSTRMIATKHMYLKSRLGVLNGPTVFIPGTNHSHSVPGKNPYFDIGIGLEFQK